MPCFSLRIHWNSLTQNWAPETKRAKTMWNRHFEERFIQRLSQNKRRQHCHIRGDCRDEQLEPDPHHRQLMDLHKPRAYRTTLTHRSRHPSSRQAWRQSTRFIFDKQPQSHGEFIKKVTPEHKAPDNAQSIIPYCPILLFPSSFSHLAGTAFHVSGNPIQWGKNDMFDNKHLHKLNTWLCWFCFTAQLISIRVANLGFRTGRQQQNKETERSEDHWGLRGGEAMER